MPATVKRSDLLFPELSYQIVGCAFEVYNELGFGHHEKYYQRAYAEALKLKELKFTEQVYFPLKFKDKVIGKFYFDFLVDEKVIVELKKDNRFSKQHIDQVKGYLKVSGLKLAILINFTRTEVLYKRIINE
ncbi:MAG: GxxExxY protein [Bacteroidetes bacterium]|nr:GxxExxY protein [Bacteroidota bacterium]